LSLQGNHDNNRRYIIGAIVLVVIVGLFLVLQATEFGKNFRTLMNSKPVAGLEPEALKPSLSEPVNKPVNEPVLENSPAEKVNPIKNLDASVTQGAPVESADKSADPFAASNALVQPAVTPDVGESKPVSSAVPASLPPVNELFVLKFRKDSWLQVKTETGTILSSHLARAGSEEIFSVKQSLYVKIGNAAGVDAVLRGVPLPISSERGNNVANLVVK
jgi:cytoskeleton protein RodZ